MPPSARNASVKVVVSDAGPLISLGRLDLLALLPEVFAQVQVPTAVLDECMARPDNQSTRNRVPAPEARTMSTLPPVAPPLPRPRVSRMWARATLPSCACLPTALGWANPW